MTDLDIAFVVVSVWINGDELDAIFSYIQNILHEP